MGTLTYIKIQYHHVNIDQDDVVMLKKMDIMRLVCAPWIQVFGEVTNNDTIVKKTGL